MSVVTPIMVERKDTPMKEYLVLTGELVRIEAENEDQMWEMLSNGEWEEVETLSEIQEVNELD